MANHVVSVTNNVACVKAFAMFAVNLIRRIRYYSLKYLYGVGKYSFKLLNRFCSINYR